MQPDRVNVIVVEIISYAEHGIGMHRLNFYITILMRNIIILLKQYYWLLIYYYNE